MNEIYNTVWQSIQAGGYRLEEMLGRIHTLFAAGLLTNEEYSALLSDANAHADAESERPETQAQLAALAARLDELEARVAALEGETGGTEDYPAWTAWDGMSSNYQPGAIVRHNGKLWQNVYQSGQNVWEPGVADARYWVEYVPETGE